MLQADKELHGALFAALGAALTAAPDSVPVRALALLAEAQLMVGDKLGGAAPKLPDQVARYALSMHGVVSDAAKARAGAAGAAIHGQVAEAAARAAGARWALHATMRPDCPMHSPCNRLPSPVPCPI
jgi:hypothetical protein